MPYSQCWPRLIATEISSAYFAYLLHKCRSLSCLLSSVCFVFHALRLCCSDFIFSTLYHCYTQCSMVPTHVPACVEGSFFIESMAADVRFINLRQQCVYVPVSEETCIGRSIWCGEMSIRVAGDSVDVCILFQSLEGTWHAPPNGYKASSWFWGSGPSFLCCRDRKCRQQPRIRLEVLRTDEDTNRKTATHSDVWLSVYLWLSSTPFRVNETKT